MRPLIFSWCSEPKHPGWDRMLRSCNHWGWSVEAHHEPWAGDIALMKVVAGNMRRWRIEGYTHLLRLDAFDMIAVGPPSELEGKLAIYGNPSLICSAEIGCWPGDYKKELYGPPEIPFWYAHSPLTLSLMQEIPERYWQMKSNAYGADQHHLADLFLDGVIPMDRAGHIIQSIGHCHPWESVFQIEGDRVRNKITNSLPLFMHGNGGPDMSWIPLKHDSM